MLPIDWPGGSSGTADVSCDNVAACMAQFLGDGLSCGPIYSAIRNPSTRDYRRNEARQRAIALTGISGTKVVQFL
jgi:hypothetical protein